MSRPDKSEERSCLCKSSFENRAHALNGLKRSGDNPYFEVAGVEPYHCNHCGTWHLGHKSFERILPRKEPKPRPWMWRQAVVNEMESFA